MNKFLEGLMNNRRNFVITISVLSVLFLGLYINFLLAPQLSRVGGIIARISKVGADLKSAESEMSDIDQLRKNIELSRDRIDTYEKTLPAEQEIPALLESLSKIARSSGVKIMGITPVNTSSEKSDNERIYREIPILISARSGYHELGAFLSRLEGTDRFMKVVDIQIRGDKSSPGLHDVEMMVLTYTLLGSR